jgi:hypothetical protein
MLEANYDQDRYEITIYTGSGNIRDKLTRKIVADWVDWSTHDGSVSDSTQRQLDLIEKEFGIKINLR